MSKNNTISALQKKIDVLQKEVDDLKKEVSTLRNTEKSLRDSENKFKTIFDSVNEQIILTSLEGIILDVNPKVEDIFGLTPEELIGLDYTELYDLLPPETLERIIALKESTRPDVEYSGTLEFEVYHKDGRKIIIETNTRLLVQDGKTEGVLTIIRNITRRRQAEEALLKMQEELDSLVKERTCELEESNIALKVLLKQRDNDKIDMEQKMLYNVKDLVEPFLNKLRETSLSKRQIMLLEIISENLDSIISPFAHDLSSKYIRLTPAEMQVANLIKQGKSTKEISAFLNMSNNTINTHRYSIRKKIGLSNKKMNLQSHLRSMK